MSTPKRKPTAAWLELSDTKTRDGRPVPLDEPTEEPRVIVSTPLRRWLEAFLPQVAAGEIDLDELLTVVDADLQTTPMVCPECAHGHVRAGSGVAYLRGVCVACYMRQLRMAHEEALAILQATREVAVAKTALRRERDLIDPDRERGHAPYRLCASCREKLPPIKVYPGDKCVLCQERDERREAMRAAMA